MGLLQLLFDYMGDCMINYKQVKMQLNDPEYCSELKLISSSIITKREVGARKVTVRLKEKGILVSFFPVFFQENMLSSLWKEQEAGFVAPSAFSW